MYFLLISIQSTCLQRPGRARLLPFALLVCRANDEVSLFPAPTDTVVRSLDDQGLTFTVHNMPGEASSVRPKMVCVIILVNLVIMVSLLLIMYCKIRLRLSRSPWSSWSSWSSRSSRSSRSFNYVIIVSTSRRANKHTTLGPTGLLRRQIFDIIYIKIFVSNFKSKQQTKIQYFVYKKNYIF